MMDEREAEQTVKYKVEESSNGRLTIETSDELCQKFARSLSKLVDSIVCKYCGKKFTFSRRWKSRVKPQFCSSSCAAKWSWENNPKYRESFEKAKAFRAKDMKGNLEKSYQRQLEDAKDLEEQGFRVIVFGRVIPDSIAIKDSKVYAVETVYNSRPDYDKYIGEAELFYDDIIWINHGYRRDGKKEVIYHSKIWGNKKGV